MRIRIGRSPFCKHMRTATDDAYALQYLINQDLSLSSHFWRLHSTTGQLSKQTPESLWILIGRPGHGKVVSWTKMRWRRRVSIPLPPACEAGALPSELHPREGSFKIAFFAIYDHGFRHHGDVDHLTLLCFAQCKPRQSSLQQDLGVKQSPHTTLERGPLTSLPHEGPLWSNDQGIGALLSSCVSPCGKVAEVEYSTSSAEWGHGRSGDAASISAFLITAAPP